MSTAPNTKLETLVLRRQDGCGLSRQQTSTPHTAFLQHWPAHIFLACGPAASSTATGRVRPCLYKTPGSSHFVDLSMRDLAFAAGRFAATRLLGAGHIGDGVRSS